MSFDRSAAGDSAHRDGQERLCENANLKEEEGVVIVSPDMEKITRKLAEQDDISEMEERVNEDRETALRDESSEHQRINQATEDCGYGFEAPLFAAVEKRDVPKVKELISLGANVNLVARIYGGHFFPLVYTPLILAAEGDCLEIFEALLQVPGINVNLADHNGGTVLHQVSGQSSEKSTRMLELLLERKDVDVNAKDIKFNFTALHWASMHRCTEAVKVLLSKEGIDVNVRDRLDGFTPLHHAVAEDDPEIVKLLLQKEGVDVNVSDDDPGSTVLTAASSQGSVEMVKLLLDAKGVDVNAKNTRDLSTALHEASENDRIDVVKLLLEKEGINVNARNASGETALHVASREGHTEIADLILAKQAESGWISELYEHMSYLLYRARRLLSFGNNGGDITP